MYTFRFNPLFGQWVMLGAPVIQPHAIPAASLLDIGRRDGFVAAAYPRQPFLAEPPARFGGKELLYREEPPVGDYELLLYKEWPALLDWKEEQWNGWLSLVQQRILQLHHNPHLHYLYLSLHTAALGSVEGYQRVGDLVATSHPICGETLLMDAGLVEKISRQEKSYCLTVGEAGTLYVPSAPTQAGEVWYLPSSGTGSVDGLTAPERKGCARLLARLFSALSEEFPGKHLILRLHSGMAGQGGGSWWIQLYWQRPESDVLPVRPLPEGLLARLRLALG